MDLNKTPNISIIEEQLNSTTFISECPATCSNEGNTLENFFIRSYRTPGNESSSKLSRLSIIIRRSLKIGTRRGDGQVVQEKKKVVQDKVSPPFTEYTDLRPEYFIVPKYGSFDFLNKLVQNKQFGQLKQFLRENSWPVTHEIRKHLWEVLISYSDKEFESSKFFYREQIESLLKSKVQNFRPAFLSEPGIVVCDHGLKEIGVINLQRLLIVIEYARPEIRFVPILYPLCAVFLHYHPVDVAFACINRLLAQGNKFVFQSEIAVYASRYTLLSMLKKFKKRVYNKLKKRLGSEENKIVELMANWHFWIFKCLPFPYLVRLIDCFLFEGQKMLARAVLTILYLWHKQQHQISKQNNDTNKVAMEDKLNQLNFEISSVASKVPVSVQTFLDIGFSIRRFSNGTLFRQQRHYENKFWEVVSKIRAEKNLRQPDDRIYTPVFISKIIDEDAAKELMSALPQRFQLETPKLLFRLSEHGTSFVQLWTRIEQADQSLLIIKSTTREVFGAYVSSSWAERNDVHERAKAKYFGTGESFVWRLDDELKLPIIYTWSDQLCDNYFMAAHDKFLIIGSGGGDAIAIRDELVEGSSRASRTYQSPELVSGGQFQIDELEVWSIPSSI
uniref:TBC1 domain family member 24 n=1 Tax=Meloidogyne enterolobii TaxID=390850 RepID=A0A6V7XZ32_MELEN|nr:unnamed protein product [Meloidogyne enterolobii]